MIKKTKTNKIVMTLLAMGMFSNVNAETNRKSDLNPITYISIDSGENSRTPHIFGPVEFIPVNLYEQNQSRLSPSVEFIDTFAPSSSELVITQNEFSLGTCSGTLLDNNIFLTSAGCIVDFNTSDMQVRFNYEEIDNNFTLKEIQSVDVISVLEQGNGSLNYALLQLSDNANTQASAISIQTPNIGDLVSIIHYPNSEPKKLSFGQVVDSNNSTLLQYDLSTESGSIGAGVLNTKGEVIALNQSNYQENPQAILMSELVKVSPILKGLLSEVTPEPEVTPDTPEVDKPIRERIQRVQKNIKSKWNSSKRSRTRADTFAKFFTLRINSASTVEITLDSETNSFLYLFDGKDENAEIIERNNNGGIGKNAKITMELDEGVYLIEATTFFRNKVGDFNLSIVTEKR